MTETMRTTVTLDLRWIGKIWMPSVICGGEKSLRIGTGPFDDDVDPFDVDDIERWMGTHTGDYSTIDDYEAVAIETRVHAPETFTASSPHNGWTRHVTMRRKTFVRAWADPASDDVWGDCTYPDEHEDG